MEHDEKNMAETNPYVVISSGNPLLLTESCNALTKAETNLAAMPSPINVNETIMSHNFLYQ